MPILRTSRVWTRQPPYPVDLCSEYADADHVFLPHTLNAYNGMNWALQGSPLRREYGELGLGLRAYEDYSDAKSYLELPPINLRGLNWPGLSIIFSSKCPVSSPNNAFVSSCVNLKSYGGWAVAYDAVTIINVGLGGTSKLPLTVSAGSFVTACVVWDRQTLSADYVQNKGTTTRNSMTYTTDFLSGDLIRRVIGYELSSGSIYRSCNSPVFMVAVFPYAFDRARQSALARNPWQIFKPASRVLYFPVSSAVSRRHHPLFLLP